MAVTLTPESQKFGVVVYVHLELLQKTPPLVYVHFAGLSRGGTKTIDSERAPPKRLVVDVTAGGASILCLPGCAALAAHTLRSRRMALATIPGYPRIGKHREMKRALEGFWSGKLSEQELVATA